MPSEVLALNAVVGLVDVIQQTLRARYCGTTIAGNVATAGSCGRGY